MNKTKLLIRARYIVLLALVAYFFIIWMYFKDNINYLTSKQLIIGLVLIPILFLIVVLGITWKKKKLINEGSTNNDDFGQDIDKADNYQINKIYFYGSTILPEGDNFADIVDNSQDLTEINSKLLDYEGLPFLVKPIQGYTKLDLENQDIDNTTPNICQLLDNLISQNQQILLTCSTKYNTLNSQPSKVNAAISMHPEWQQNYISSSNPESTHHKDNKELIIIKDITLYLCLAERHSHDIDYINDFAKAEVVKLGFPEADIKIVNLLFNPDQKTEIDTIKDIFVGVEPEKNTSPKLKLIFSIDSEICQDWLEDNQTLTQSVNLVVPEEAATLLIIWNETADEVLDINSDTDYYLIKFNKEINSNSVYNQDYLDLLKNLEYFIKKRITTNNIKDSDDKTQKKSDSDKDKSVDESVILNQKILILSDLNILKQPYQTSLLLTLIDRLQQNGAVVENFQLGLHMQRNSWIKFFISLTLFINATFESLQDYDLVVLITEHKDQSLLWVAEPKLE